MKTLCLTEARRRVRLLQQHSNLAYARGQVLLAIELEDEAGRLEQWIERRKQETQPSNE